MAAFESPATARIAEERLAHARAAGMVSDWAGAEAKELDFSRLAVAVQQVFPPGGSIETGVLRGGTSSLLIQACAPESFHLSIDPFGLPEQSYPSAEYVEWKGARLTMRRLHTFADEHNVTYFHYLMGSHTFVQADLFRHPGQFNLVHLDGDHTAKIVEEELAYFIRKLSGPTVYILDDHDEHFPGVEQAVRRFEGRITPLFHKIYDFPNYGPAGFSAWLREP